MSCPRLDHPGRGASEGRPDSQTAHGWPATIRSSDMMPISLLLALLIAFGLDLSWAERPDVDRRSAPEAAGGRRCWSRLAALRAGRLGGLAGRASRLRHRPGLPALLRLGSRLLTVAVLGIYAWIIHACGWSKLVLSDWGLQGSSCVDDLAVFLPFIFIQLLVWSGPLPRRAGPPRLAAPLSAASGRLPDLKTRQSLGLILPVVLIFVLRQDVFAPALARVARESDRRAPRARRPGRR